MDPNVLVTAAILLLLAVIAAAAIARRRRSRQLARRFGPEYQRTVDAMGNRGRAEADLLAREKRVQELEIVPLAAHEAQRFRMEWEGLQAHFVDSPRSAVAEADLLVRDVMLRRGYPMGDFESRAADLSVDHPQVVEHYRAAHAIAMNDRGDRPDTEALRQALVHYRALFSELLEVAKDPVAQRQASVDAPQRPLHGTQPDRALARDEAATDERRQRSER